MRDPEKVFRLFQVLVEHHGPNRSKEPTVYEGASQGYWKTRELDGHFLKLEAHVQGHPGIRSKVKRDVLEHLEALRRHLADVEDVAKLIAKKIRPFDQDANESDLKVMLQRLDDLDDRDDAFAGPAGGA